MQRDTRVIPHDKTSIGPQETCFGILHVGRYRHAFKKTEEMEKDSDSFLYIYIPLGGGLGQSRKIHCLDFVYPFLFGHGLPPFRAGSVTAYLYV